MSCSFFTIIKDWIFYLIICIPYSLFTILHMQKCACVCTCVCLTVVVHSARSERLPSLLAVCTYILRTIRWVWTWTRLAFILELSWCRETVKAYGKAYNKERERERESCIVHSHAFARFTKKENNSLFSYKILVFCHKICSLSKTLPWWSFMQSSVKHSRKTIICFTKFVERWASI